MKKKTELLKYKYLISVLFIAVVFSMFFFNVKDAVSNYFDRETEASVKTVAADLENVESATYPFININGLYQGVMQRNYLYDVNEEDELIRTGGKYLISTPSTYSRDGVVQAAGTLKKTSQWLQNQGIPMLYVQAASKMTLSDKDSMVGVPNTSYDKANAFLKELNSDSVDYADTREWIKNEGMEAFYKTDHHWTTGTCLKVASEICELLNEKYNMEIDESLFDVNSFDMKTNKDAFLGAEGRRAGRYYVGLDDFSVIKPAYDTEFHVEIGTKEGEHFTRDGSFEDSIMDITKDAEHYSFEDSAYYIYWGGDYSSIHVDNKKNNQGKSVVIIKDSYGVPVSALMAGSVKSMDVFDVRYYNEKQPLAQVIENINPDAVVFIYGTGYLDKPYMFDVCE